MLITANDSGNSQVSAGSSPFYGWLLHLKEYQAYLAFCGHLAFFSFGMSLLIIHKTAKYLIRSSTPTVHCGYNWRFNGSDTFILNFLFNFHRKEVISDFLAGSCMLWWIPHLLAKQLLWEKYQELICFWIPPFNVYLGFATSFSCPRLWKTMAQLHFQVRNKSSQLGLSMDIVELIGMRH